MKLQSSVLHCVFVLQPCVHVRTTFTTSIQHLSVRGQAPAVLKQIDFAGKMLRTAVL